MAKFLWKPIAQGSVGGGRATALFNDYDPSDQYVSAGVFSPDGKLIENFTLAPRGQPNAELPHPESATKFYGSKPGSAYGDGFYFEATTASGKKQKYNIPSGGGRYAGDIGNPDPQFENKGLTGGGYGGQFAPGQIGYGFFPAFLGDEFPQFNYNMIDPEAFAAQYGDFSRNELYKNFDVAKDLSLKELDLELESLQRFVPAASALKRQETSIDNIFNQAQRTSQVDSVLPNARGDLNAQRERANAYAEGRLPDSVENQVLEGNVRSRSADQSTFGGFGVRSPAAQKASQLMSAEQRLQLSQYGDQLLGTNIDRSANLLLAPTEYSDAGSQIRVNPSVSPAQLVNQNLGFIHQATSISPSQALSTAVGQEQFQSSGQYSADLAKFGYVAQYAGAVAGAAQLNSNTQTQFDLMDRYQEIFGQGKKEAQDAGTAGSIASAVTSLITAATGLIKVVSGGKETTTTDGGDEPYVPTPNENIPQPESPIADVPSASPTATPPPPGPYAPPTPEPLPEPTDYSKSLQQDGGPQLSKATAKTVVQQGNSVLNASGVSNTPGPNKVNVGVDNSGKPVYYDKSLKNSTNANLGKEQIGFLKQVFDPLNVFSKQDATTLDQIATVSADVNFISSLNDAYQRGDRKGFVNTLMKGIQQPLINSLTDNADSRAGLGAAAGAYRLFDEWGRMSPGQRALGITNTAIQGYQFTSGNNLYQEPIIDSVKNSAGEVVRPGLNVGQALSLFQSGYNVYSLAKNWDQYNTIQKVAAGTGTAANIAETAKQFGMLGKGTTGAQVAVSAPELASSGATMAPHLGNGAVVVAEGGQLPNGFVAVGTHESGGTIAVPKGLEGTVPTPLQQVAGGASIALGAYSVYKGWGTGGTKGAVNGALGGTAMVSGLDMMLGYTNPYVAGAIIAASVISNAVSVGKSGDQKSRDAARSPFAKLGASNKDGVVTLADGSTASIGIDGHGNQRSYANPDQINTKYKGKLNAWDIDYTNDLDFAAGMGGVALSRIVNGGANKPVDQVGGNIGNASLANVGYGKEFSQDNFNKMAANQRAIYAQSGIKSKSDAFQLANQAYAEGRLTEDQLVASHQAFNFIFDNDYNTAKKIMGGRGRGVEVAHEQASVPPSQNVEPEKVLPTKVTRAAINRPASLADAQLANRFRYQGASA